MLTNHGSFRRAVKCLRELRHVRDYHVHTSTPRGMAVGEGTFTHPAIGDVFASDLRPCEEEALGWAKSVDQPAALVHTGGAERKSQAAIVRQVFPERELAVDVQVVDRDLAAVLVHEALGELPVSAGVLGRPPVAHRTARVELP